MMLIMEKDILVFDIETKKSFEEAGGRDKLDQLGVSVLGAYSYQRGQYLAFEEHELDKFKEWLEQANLLIGFNIKSFDLPVLEPYLPVSSYNLAFLDLMDDVVLGAGFRLSLDNLAGNTIGAKKTADGLQALRWYKEGKIEEIKKYCLQDVRVTKELYEFGKKHGHIFYLSREQGQKMALAVSWGQSAKKDARQILNEAFLKRRRVEIDYITGLSSKISYSPKIFSEVLAGEANEQSAGGARHKRLVDIYKFNRDSFEGYCHLRKAKRIFKIERVLAARLTDKTYQIQTDVQGGLF
ncbi:MAG: ribonuclease H-like domain-containing protein [Candidatus Niyogibacteria bacterium]|nr:ribonuclease H-like domain-containing protein [Candidatus Niyogibacteria bacterium]